MTAILGISAFFHDSAAALVVDGNIVAAAQEERFSRRKHDERFPREAVRYCLAAAGIGPRDLDWVGYYEKPLLKFDRLLETALAFAPRGLQSFSAAIPVWLREKLHVPRVLRRELPGYDKRFVFATHHESHAASAFFPSPYDEAAILTVDGVGEWSTATCGAGRGNSLRLTHELRFPHSLGLLYSAFTTFCGFRLHSGEYKLMGLAPYGEPRFERTIRERLIDLKEDGSFRLDLSYFNYCTGLTMTSRKFANLFGGPPRAPEGPLTQREMDLAASVQKVTEDVLLRMARHLHSLTRLKNLCLAGGVALNCVANGKLLRQGPFESIWVQPAAGDAGGALGVALLIAHQLLDGPRVPLCPDSMQGSFLGPDCTESAIREALDSQRAVYRRYDDDESLVTDVSEWLSEGRVVGWIQGRMEFGPRALGARSILGDPRNREMQSVMNLKIKFRESFRPFAPAVLHDRVGDFFELGDEAAAAYMLLVANVNQEHQRRLTAVEEQVRGIDRLRLARSSLPAVTHVDGSARVQTVDPQRHVRFHALLKAFAARTGTPVLVNTSFNVRGEPIVCTAAEAWRCFMATDMDVLVIERFVLRKSDQPQRPGDRDAAHTARFDPD